MRAAASLAVLLAAAPAAARQVSRVELPDAVYVNGTELRLNGAGIRRQRWIEVYVAALYLGDPSSDPEAIVAADAPRRVRLVFLRDVDRASILNAFRQEFEASCGAEAPALVKQLDALEPAIGDVKRGGVIEVTYAPGAGTTVTGPRGTIVVEGKPLADALLRSWLGPRSADGDLKRKMLGK